MDKLKECACHKGEPITVPVTGITVPFCGFGVTVDSSVLPRCECTIAPGPEGTFLMSDGNNFYWEKWPLGKAVDTPMILYVRPDGNDSNDGSENTPEKAFKTVKAAAEYFTSQYFLTGQGTITIT